MMPYLSIFGLNIPAYTLLLFVSVWVGLWLAAQEARRLGLDGDVVHNVGFYGLVATMLGARLSYVLGGWVEMLHTTHLTGESGQCRFIGVSLKQSWFWSNPLAVSLS